MARKGLIITGAAIGVAGIMAGGGLAVAAVLVEMQTVEGFARAPVGCTTTLEFDATDTFTLFVETKGSTDDLGGDCEGSGVSYSRVDDTPPKVELTMLDRNDAPVPLGPANGYSYDTNDFVGTSYATVDVTVAGAYRLTVSSDDDDFAIAVGRDPAADSAIYLAAGITLAGLGVLLGATLMVIGAVTSRPNPPSPPVSGASSWSGPAGPGVAGFGTTPAPPPPMAPGPPGSPLLPPGSPLPPPPPPVVGQ